MSSWSLTGSSPIWIADATTSVGARSSLGADSGPAAAFSRSSASGPTTRKRHGLVRWWFGAQRASSNSSSSVSRSTGAVPKTLCVRRVRVASSTSTRALVVLVVVQRLVRELVALLVVELDLEQVAAVVVGGQQREAPVAQQALVDGEVGELGGGDDPAPDERDAPDERHRRGLPLLAAPRAHDFVVEVELPLRMVRGGLVGGVGVSAEGGRLPAVLGGAEGDEADQLEAGRRRRRRRDPGAPVPGAVGIEQDVAGVPDVLEVGGGGEELVAQAVRPAAVGQQLLRRLGGEAGDDALLGRHGAALYEAMVELQGLHPLKHALRFGARVDRAVAPDPARVVALARELAPDVAGAIAALVVPGDAGDFDVLAWAQRPPDRPLGAGHAVLLDGPRHLGNVGAAIRVAAAAGVAGVLVRGEADPWHPAAVRGAAGLQYAVPVARVAEAPPDRPLVALDPAGGPLRDVPADAVLAFGAERHGLSAEIRERADMVCALPMAPGVSSLNLATAVAAVLYVLRLT